MPTENKTAEPLPSLATGAKLDPSTWADFAQRLRYDCVGAGVRDHCTANAIFIVQAKRIIYGIDTDYSDNRVIIVSCDEAEWFTVQEYWDDADGDMRDRLNALAQDKAEKDFLALDRDEQLEILAELEDHQVVGWDETWEYVNAHFTKDAAEAFIRRKKHDYRKGMRVYVDCQSYAWEFNAIKEAILNGTLTYAPKMAA
jgi:hypothetical protein